MPLRTCTYTRCSQPAERTRGSCMICAAHYCTKHLAPPFHPCPTEETDHEAYWTAYNSARSRYLTELLEKVNADELMAVARKVRFEKENHGEAAEISCTVPALVRDAAGRLDLARLRSKMGGMNIHLEIKFADGVVWLARIRQEDPTSAPRPIPLYNQQSEVATLCFLEKIEKVPTPCVFHHAFDPERNKVGVPFMLMEKLPGRALNWAETSEEQKTKVMEQLADIFLELEKHPFELSGSIYPADGTDGVAAFAQVHWFTLPYEPMRPFSSLKRSLGAMIKQQMELVTTGEVCALAVDNYLTLRWQYDAIPRMLQSAPSNGPFFLKHSDDKGDHILVDDEYNITGIIDWESASTECKAYAFSSPGMMWPMAACIEGYNELLPEELQFADIFKARGREDMAEIVLNGRKSQRFLFNTEGAANSKEEFVALFRGLREALGDELDEFYEEWKQKVILEYGENDPELQRLLREASQS
ncbi:hypothetical protein MMC30_008467 [Trapelia coarctata]|nr:hypothetical protein [Trapelia coarctata]